MCVIKAQKEVDNIGKIRIFILPIFDRRSNREEPMYI